MFFFLFFLNLLLLPSSLSAPPQMAMVNLMTPGLAFFYGGLVRQQNVLTIIMQNYVSMGLITIVWVMWGFSLCFGESGTFLGNPASFYFFENVNGNPLPHQGKDKAGEAFVDGIPGLVFAGKGSECFFSFLL
jgi:Amt family ammonium transporter